MSKVIMTNEEYHAHEALGSTNLKTILESPAKYIWQKTHLIEPTAAMIFGTKVHEAILEPSLFEEKMRIMPEFSGKGSVAQREEWTNKTLSTGYKIISCDDYERIGLILKSIKNHTQASRLLEHGKSEESYFATIDDVPCKARPDFLRDGKIIVDVKTTSGSLKDFYKAIANFGYHVSSAVYLDVISSALNETYDEFIIIAVQSVPPFETATFLVDSGTIDAGKSLYKKAIKIYKECKKTDKWSTYPDEIIPIALPSWAWPSEQ